MPLSTRIFAIARISRHIKKTLDTRLTREEHAVLVAAIREGGSIPLVTFFDESAVDLCADLGIRQTSR